jgi:Helix-turn-helix domain
MKRAGDGRPSLPTGFVAVPPARPVAPGRRVSGPGAPGPGVSDQGTPAGWSDPPGAGADGAGVDGAGTGGRGGAEPGLGRAEGADGLPLLPGFREMAVRRMAGERRRLVAELTARRQVAGLSQTQVAAWMGTSQSAVARIEAGPGDVRATTLERYAAAVGGELSWRLSGESPRGGI